MTYPSDEVRSMVRDLTGLEFEDAMLMEEERQRLEEERIRAAGYCCRAGLVAHPHPCPWHGAE